jgi:glycosyltransferase involved in cell wall biosynthesis
MPEVSVVIPTKNEENTIGTCIGKIKRVFNEHHIDGEIIVADNSTDNTPEIAKGMGAKRNLRYILIQNAARRRLRDFARHKLWAYVFGGGFQEG